MITMNRSFLIAACLSILGVQALAQQSFNKGDNVLNLTVGFGNALYHGSGFTNNFPPLGLSYERGIKDDLIDENGHLGIGGYIGYVGAKYRYNYMGEQWGYNYSSILIGPRASFHYQFVPKLDTYAGLTLAYNVVSAKNVGTLLEGSNFSAKSSGIVLAGHIGGRYYFSENLGALAELGFGVANINLGLALKVQ